VFSSDLGRKKGTNATHTVATSRMRRVRSNRALGGAPPAARPLQRMVGPLDNDASWSRSFTACLNRRSAVFENSSQLAAKLRTVIVPVHGHGVLHGSLQELFFGVGRYRDRAIHFAWKFTAVYVFSSHENLLEIAGSARPRVVIHELSVSRNPMIMICEALRSRPPALRRFIAQRPVHRRVGHGVFISRERRG